MDDLGAADLFLRAMLLEETGVFEESDRLAAVAHRRLYHPEYREASEAAIDHVVARLGDVRIGRSPIVDIASGRGTLVRALNERTSWPVVATDVSPLVLHRMLRRFAALDIRPPIGAVASDAAQLPVDRASVSMATSFLGLANVSQPAAVLAELRRVIDGHLFAVHYFASDGDPNLAEVEPTVREVLVRDEFEALMVKTGWQFRIEAERSAAATPTAVSELIEGAAIDAFPRWPTTLTWCVVVAW